MGTVSDREVTPRSLVLDLLRVAEARAIAVRALVEIGALFGFTGNSIRVAVTRLVGAGLVESDERGSYRLTPQAAPLSAHVEGWRRGEGRLRAWSGEWLAVWLPRSAARPERRRSERASSMLGLRPGLTGIWVRPDNLAEPRSATVAKLRELGLESDAHAFSATDFDAELVHRWRVELWKPRELALAQRSMRRRLETSARKVERMPVGPAAVETFLLGGAAIRLLSTDPLLPAEIADPGERAELTRAMLDYDAIGRKIWQALGSEVARRSAPAHLTLLGGAA